jgi:hypothetical protein
MMRKMEERSWRERRRAYYHHNQTKNRIRYLAGAAAGIVLATLLGAGLFLVARSPSNAQFIDSRLLLLILMFAGMGSITSVLTRISSIDLSEETSDFSVFISGFARPVVAIFFAIVVYLILTSKIVDIKFGNPPGDQANGVYLVSSFLCGFSERFATDIIANLPTATSPPPPSGKTA